MVRPSTNSTLRTCSPSGKRTSFTRSPALLPVVVMPSLQTSNSVHSHDTFYSTQLPGAESKIPGQGDGFEPEFRGQIVAVDVHMGRFIGLVTVEIDAVGTAAHARGSLPHEGRKNTSQMTVYLLDKPGDIRVMRPSPDFSSKFLEQLLRFLFTKLLDHLIPQRRIPYLLLVSLRHCLEHLR